MNDELPCASKIMFKSQSEANAAGLIAEGKYGHKLKSYQCQFCELWHLASGY